MAESKAVVSQSGDHARLVELGGRVELTGALWLEAINARFDQGLQIFDFMGEENSSSCMQY